jgi:hypothetical protein
MLDGEEEKNSIHDSELIRTDHLQSQGQLRVRKIESCSDVFRIRKLSDHYSTFLFTVYPFIGGVELGVMVQSDR